MTGRLHQRRSVRTRNYRAAIEIDPHTTDIRLAIKRQIWGRGMTLTDLGKAVHLSAAHIEKTLSAGRNSKKIWPKLLDRIIEAADIPQTMAKRLHYLAAMEHGWKLDLKDLPP